MITKPLYRFSQRKFIWSDILLYVLLGPVCCLVLFHLAVIPEQSYQALSPELSPWSNSPILVVAPPSTNYPVVSSLQPTTNVVATYLLPFQMTPFCLKLDTPSSTIIKRLVFRSRRAFRLRHDHRALLISVAHYLQPFRRHEQFSCLGLSPSTTKNWLPPGKSLTNVVVANQSCANPRHIVGGSSLIPSKIPLHVIDRHLVTSRWNSKKTLYSEAEWEFIEQLPRKDALKHYQRKHDYFLVDIPISNISDHLSLRDLVRASKIHCSVHIKSRTSISTYRKVFKSHVVKGCCREFLTVFRQINPNKKELIAYTDKETINRHFADPTKWVVKSCSLATLDATFSLSLPQLREIGIRHGNLGIQSKSSLSVCKDKFRRHRCRVCQSLFAVSRVTTSAPIRAHVTETADADMVDDTPFPPARPVKSNWDSCMKNFCESFTPVKVEEEGCAVCAQSSNRAEMTPLSNYDLSPLKMTDLGVTRRTRKTAKQIVTEIPGPVLVSDLKQVCSTCRVDLEAGKMPPLALANGLWIGEVPDELKCLSYAEKLVISRVRYNRCVVHVSIDGSLNRKMKGNAVLFRNPTVEIYDKLPPRKADLDQVLAIQFTGPAQPTKEDIRRVPLLVRRNKIANALEWLKLNHSDYIDLIIDNEALNEYPDEDLAVPFQYTASRDNDHIKAPETSSLHNTEGHDGTETGPCPIAVHGLSGDTLANLSSIDIKARAIQHLRSGGKFLEVRHSSEMESIYNNPQLYPRIFPWLFPYGLGGIGCAKTKRISEAKHKEWLLLYHDKRFQTDPYFPLIAFNHMQIKEASTGGYILTKRSIFTSIARRLLSLDLTILDTIMTRLESNQERVFPITEEEKKCFAVIHDLDHVAAHVKGSLTSKKHRRNEAYAMMAYQGAPSWFITACPADIHHPLSIYYADEDILFRPTMHSREKTQHLIASNPVAAARFFDYMIQQFIKHVLGFGSDHAGIFGETSAYYGTVEEQGRLTLHLHLLLWIRGAPSPQEIRERIMNPDSEFRKNLITYLESCHQGELFDATTSDMAIEIETMRQRGLWSDPKNDLPLPPPPPCDLSTHTVDCSKCTTTNSWRNHFKRTVNLLLMTCNRHNCFIKDEKGISRSSCILKGKGVCKARFPRPLVQNTAFDPETGSLNMRHREPWINTINPILTYLFGCNTDVTCLLSGTAVKAVIAYITDYTTKPKLKTYAIFDTLRSTIKANQKLVTDDKDAPEKTRKLMTQIVNQLTARMEIGAPLASLFLLGKKDWYSSHTFIPFFWNRYYRYILGSETCWTDPDNDERVLIRRGANMSSLIALSGVEDYIYRPTQYESMSLYDWCRRATKHTLSLKQRENIRQHREAVSRLAAGLSASDTYVFDEQEENDEISDYSEYSDKDNTEKLTHPGLPTLINQTEITTFLPDHPQADTHGIRVADDSQFLVPNFLGPPLPRKDVSDRELYCSAMLCLFKPWRSASHLRSDGVTWSSTFDSYVFTPRQLQLMNHFNLKYECNDARDNFSQQRNLKLRDLFNAWGNATMINGTDVLEDIDPMAAYDDMVGLASVCNSDNLTGPKYNHYDNQMTNVETKMNELGWTHSVPTFNTKTEFKSQLGSVYWNNLVKITRQAIIEARRAKSTMITELTNTWGDYSVYVGEGYARIRSYLRKGCRLRSLSDKQMINELVTEFQLNKEQERAFCIIANHLVLGESEQLKMILAGMAGTGKSQVVKCVVKLFEKKGVSDQILLLAPTGAAAAVIGGSTYHSALGIGKEVEGLGSNATNLATLRTEHACVRYIFLDEFSMCGLEAIYKISEKCCLLRNVHDKPFGGINIIFAGDFAQLPPVKTSPLYKWDVGMTLESGMTAFKQRETIGKSIWHQFTTTVILRQNMRQRSQSKNDVKLRRALENMRYKACDEEDITFLRTLCVTTREKKELLSSPQVRNVSIIVARNAYRDRINELGALRFAADTGQSLIKFRSQDQWPKNVRNQKSTAENKLNNWIPDLLQKIFWSLRPGATQHHPGELPLCIGMPVMIKRNQGTECNITNGAEGTVVGVESAIGDHGQSTAKVVFVELTNCPREVKIGGLPPNVVPITAHRTSVDCSFPDDSSHKCSREQVPILLNFAMTDFAAQGRTRQYNPVDLTDCDTHQSYYVCLSRSSSAGNTFILSDISPYVITGNMSAQLRQEFRVLEVLDEVTRLVFEEQISEDDFENRSDAIRAYRYHNNGAIPCPAHVHKALAWSSANPIRTDRIWNAKWQVIGQNKDTCSAPKQDARCIDVSDDMINLKRKATDCLAPASKKPKLGKGIGTTDENPTHATNKKTLSSTPSTTLIQAPRGLLWSNNSCAYDALLTVLYDTWQTNNPAWEVITPTLNPIARQLLDGFRAVKSNLQSLEKTREDLAQSLNSISCSLIPERGVYTSVLNIFALLFGEGNYLARKTQCTNCEKIHATSPMSTIFNCSANRWREFKQFDGSLPFVGSSDTGQWMNVFLNYCIKREHPCTSCGGSMMRSTIVNHPPPLICMDMELMNSTPVNILSELNIRSYLRNDSFKYRLAGIIYHGDGHYVSRIHRSDGSYWFHDGITTANICKSDKTSSTTSIKGTWETSKGGTKRRVNAVIYELIS